MLIADESHLERLVKFRVRDYDVVDPFAQELELRPRFPNLLETVHFVPSWQSWYIQLADFVAYFIMRAWRAGNWEKPGAEPRYDEFIKPAIRRVEIFPWGARRLPKE